MDWTGAFPQGKEERGGREQPGWDPHVQMRMRLAEVKQLASVSAGARTAFFPLKGTLGPSVLGRLAGGWDLVFGGESDTSPRR